jgi:hypothetical protein
MDLAQAVGAVEVVDLAGEEFPVRLLTLKEWGAVTAWLKRANPSPVTRAVRAIDEAAADGAPLSAPAREALLDHAQRAALSWPPRLGSSEWFDAIDRTDGGPAKLIFEVLSKADAAFTSERAEVLARRFEIRDYSELLRVALYGTPPRVPKGSAAQGAA